MIYFEDNFLPEDQFLALKERVQKRFIPANPKLLITNGTEPVRLTHHDRSGNWREGCNYLGLECIPAIEKINATLEKINIENLLNWSIWYQYIINTMTLPPHQDQGLRKSDQANTYTAIIYTSDWEKGWGGEFIVGEPMFSTNDTQRLAKAGPHAESLINIKHTIAPIPNRLLVWSRDEWHAVKKVTCPNPNYIRSFFGTGWSSVDVLDTEINEKALLI